MSQPWTKRLAAASAIAGLALFVVAGCENPASDAKAPTNTPGNDSPIIQSLRATPDTISPGEGSTIICAAADADGDSLTFNWTYDSGTLSGMGREVYYSGDFCCSGVQIIRVTVSDGNGGSVEKATKVVVR